MKKLMISLAALTAVGAAVPAAAAAQTWGYTQHASYSRYDGYGVGSQVNDRQVRINDQIRRAEARGLIGRAEAMNLRAQMGETERMEKRYRASRGGLTPREVAEVNARLDRVEQRLASIGRYAPRYGYGYGRW